MLGVCPDWHNPGGRATVAQLTGFDLVRLVAYDDLSFYDYCTDLQHAGIKVAVVLASETFAGRDYASVCMELAQHITPEYWIIGNEQDANWLGMPSDSSWVLEPEQYAELWHACEVALRAYQPGAVMILGGFVSGQPGVYALYVDAIERVYVGATINGVDIHPYSKATIEAQHLLEQYRDLQPTIPLYVFEWNRPGSQVKAFADMLSNLVEEHCWYCWSDAQTPGMGLVNEDGKPNVEYMALTGNIQIPIDDGGHFVMAEFVLGFADYATAHPEVGHPVESEWTERAVPAVVRRQDTSTGTLRYYQQTNEIVFTPLPNS